MKNVATNIHTWKLSCVLVFYTKKFNRSYTSLVLSEMFFCVLKKTDYSVLIKYLDKINHGEKKTLPLEDLPFRDLSSLLLAPFMSLHQVCHLLC